MHRNRTFYKIFISYVLILIIPLSIMGIINYARVYSIAQNKNKLEYMTRLQQAADMLTKRAQEIDNMAYELSQNPRVKTFLYSTQASRTEKVFQVQDIQKDMVVLGTPNKFISKVVIYSKNNDFFVSSDGFYSPEMYYDSIYRYKGLTFDKWMEFVKSKSTAVYMPSAVRKDGEKLVNLITYHYSFDRDDDLGSLLINIDEDKYTEILGKVTSEENGIYYLVDNKESVITTNDVEHKYENDLPRFENMEVDSGFKIINSKGKKMMMLYSISQYNKWKYVSLLPLDAFMAEANGVRLITIIEILVCILIGLLGSVLAANKNYGYIDGIIKFIRKNYTYSNDTTNDYELISEVLQNTFNEVSVTKEDIRRQIPVLKQNYLLRLLRNSTLQEGESLDFNKYLDIDLNKMELTTVVLFRIKEFNNMPQVNNTERGLVVLGMINILEEMSNSIGIGYALEIEEDQIALIIGVEGNNKVEFNKTLIEMLQHAKEFLKEKLNITVSIGIGDIYSGFRQISKAYDNSKQALDYTLLNNDDIVFYSDVDKKSDKTYNFPLEKEVQIINFVKAGKNEQAVGVLEYLYNENLIDGELSSQMARYFTYDVYNMIIRLLNEIKVDESHPVFRRIRNEDTRLKTRNIEEIFTDFTQIINEICDLINSRKKSGNNELIDRIIRYIEAHYTDSQLSLEVVADNFNVTSQYLSKFFKDNTGYNYVEYINIKRIEKAKELLKVKENKVKEAALESGFDNIGNFINVFKKHVGVTPGQYKEKGLE